MKTAAWVTAALLIGMVLGSWGLKADLRKARRQITDLENQARRGEGKHTRLAGITTMLNIPQVQETASSRTPGPRGPGADARAEGRTNAPGAQAQGAAPSATDHERGTNRVRQARTMRENIETAANVWKVRSDLARNSFLMETTTNQGQAAQFDVVMTAMNMRLSNSIRTWVDYLKAQQEMTPESGVRMMNELSGAIAQAYTDLDREIPEWREKTEGRFNAMDLVDPQVAMPMTEVEDILRTQRWDRAESFTNVPGEE